LVSKSNGDMTYTTRSYLYR